MAMSQEGLEKAIEDLRATCDTLHFLVMTNLEQTVRLANAGGAMVDLEKCADDIENVDPRSRPRSELIARISSAQALRKFSDDLRARGQNLPKR